MITMTISRSFCQLWELCQTLLFKTISGPQPKQKPNRGSFKPAYRCYFVMASSLISSRLQHLVFKSVLLLGCGAFLTPLSFTLIALSLFNLWFLCLECYVCVTPPQDMVGLAGFTVGKSATVNKDKLHPCNLQLSGDDAFVYVSTYNHDMVLLQHTDKRPHW